MLNSLRNKIIFLICCVALTVALFIGGLTYYRIVLITTETAIEGLAGETSVTALKFKGAYDEMQHDAFIVSRTPPFKGIIRSSRNNGIDPLDGSSNRLWRTRLETIFISVMQDRPHYTQMRYIGFADQGRELVRVNRTGTGFTRVPHEELQQKEQEPYFQRGKNLDAGEFAFSEVTYNRERGQIDDAMIPTVRVIIPIFDSEDKPFGLMVINANYEILLRNQFARIKPNRHTYVINHLGDYMEYFPGQGPLPLEFHGHYTKEPPAAVKKILETSLDEYTFEDNGAIDYFVRLNTDPVNEDAFLGVVLSVKKDQLLQRAYDTRRDILILSGLLIVAALMVALMLAQWLTRPLQKMTKEILRADDENTALDLPVNLQDEIGDLARAFSTLTNDLIESKTRTGSILDNAIDGIITIDTSGIVQSFNRACEILFGYNAEEVIGQNVRMLMPEPDKSAHDGYIKSYLDTGINKIIGFGREVRGRRKDGSTFPMELSVGEFKLGSHTIFTGVVRDITDRKKIQQEREKLIKDLEMSNQELDNFAYIASHDLKAPLRVIDNASKWLEEDLEDHLDEDTRESMDLMRSRVRRMEKLLDDLLEYSRIGKTSDDRFKEKLTAEALLNDIKALLSPSKAFVIEGSQSLKDITVTRMPLQQILLNLISNAIKHHDKDNGRIEVSVKDQGEMYEFTVKDDGPGIPKEFHEKIFKMFQTLKPRDQVEGSGMGLAMVFKNVETFGGKVTLTSQEGKGSAFHFTWPKKEESWILLL